MVLINQPPDPPDASFVTTIQKTRRGFFRRGNSLIDTVLVLPILLGLTFGGVEFGYFFFVKHTLDGAAREGAREAISPQATTANVNARIAASLHAAGLQPSSTEVDPKFTVTIDPSNVSAAVPGTQMTVTVSVPWATIGVAPMHMIGAGKAVSGATVMRKEGSAS